jgi:hypothetical protein
MCQNVEEVGVETILEVEVELKDIKDRYSTLLPDV